MPNILIDLAAEFTGKKAFDKAGSATSSLERSVKKLGKTFVSVYAAQKVLQFGISTVKAFAADEASAQRLTHAVNNLGLGFQDLQIRQFIQSLETTSGVLDDQLRPAMQALLLQTGSVVKAQELLRLSIDTATGSGEDLLTVSNDLAQAYVGNVKGLRKYYLGLTQAELKASSFSDIQEKLSKQFSGANAYYLTTYAGQMSLLAVAADNAKETIGKGLVDALEILGGSGGIQSIADQMATFAKNAASFTTNLALVFRRLKDVITVNLKDLKEVQALYDELNAPPKSFGGIYATQYKATVTKAAAAAEKVITDRIKADKAAAAAKLAADKKAAANKLKLDKASAIFDLAKIGIAAALKGKISEEEKIRLLLMQAIADEDATKAEALSKKLEDIQKKNADIAKSLTDIQAAKDPFSAWVSSLTAAAGLLGAMPSLIRTTTMVPGVTFNPSQNKDRNYDNNVAAAAAQSAGGTSPTFTGSETIDQILTIVENVAAEAAAAASAAADSVAESQKVVDILAAAATNSSLVTGINFNPSQNRDRNYDAGYGVQSPVSITVNNNGSVIMQDELVKVVNDAVIAANTNGYNNYRPGAILP